MSEVIKIVIAAEHECVRVFLQMALQEESRIRMLGIAANGRDLVQQACELKPCVIITDYKMQVMDGLEATLQIKKQLPQVRIVVYSENEDAACIKKIMDAGAKGYVLKTTPVQQLVQAIYTVAEGQEYTCHNTLQRLHDQRRLARQTSATVTDAVFTGKESEIVTHILHDLTDNEIATAMAISVRTVHSHKEKIRGKLGVKNNNGIRHYARVNGLLSAIVTCLLTGF